MTVEKRNPARTRADRRDPAKSHHDHHSFSATRDDHDRSPNRRSIVSVRGPDRRNLATNFSSGRGNAAPVCSPLTPAMVAATRKLEDDKVRRPDTCSSIITKDLRRFRSETMLSRSLRNHRPVVLLLVLCSIGGTVGTETLPFDRSSDMERRLQGATPVPAPTTAGPGTPT